MSIDRQSPQQSTDAPSQFWTGWRHADSMRWIFYVLFYTVLVNIPFWTASRWLGILQNGWFCMEYIAVGLLALFVPRILAATLLLLFIVVDLLSGVCHTYFLSIALCFANISAVREFTGSRLLAGTAVCFMALLFAAIAAFYPDATIKTRYRTRVAVCLIAFAAISLAVDSPVTLRRNGYIRRFLHLKSRPFDAITADYFTEFRLSRIPTLRLAEIEHNFAKIQKKVSDRVASSPPVASAAAQAIESAGIAPGQSRQEMPNLVVVLVESWGLDSESTVRNALVSAYAQPDLLARYEVLQGTVPFYGPTIAGEARELCGSMMGFGIMEASSQDLGGCLPDRLTALGYRSVALHGMDGNMFSRSTWYDTIGFQETWFKDRFQQEGLPNCQGVFPGTCDADIAKWMSHRLETRKADPEFLYWVTLNSHLPVLVPAPLTAAASCSFTPSVSQQPALCSWYQLITNVHQSVAGIAMANLGRPTVFAIVGDHAPPFGDRLLRYRFSPSIVPYVLLVPRRSNTTPVVSNGQLRGKMNRSGSSTCRVTVFAPQLRRKPYPPASS